MTATARERAGLALIVIATLVVTAAPYLEGWRRCPPDREFLGLIGPYGNDQAFYLGWGPQQARLGHVLFEDKYNGHTDRRLVFNPLWLLMGWGARLFDTSVLAAFHVERVLFSALLLLVVHRITRRFVEGAGWRLLAVFLAAFSSGFGALGIPWREWATGKDPATIPGVWLTPDLWVVESNIFFTLLGEVVLPCATLLFLLAVERGFATLVLGTTSPVAAGLAALLLGTVYPYAVVSTWTILAAAAALAVAQGRPIRWALTRYAVIVAISAPIVAYDGLLVLTDPRLTTGQALYASPSPLLYLFGFGIVGLLAAAGLPHLWRDGPRSDRFLLAWIAGTAVAMYVPRSIVPFQMQLVLGLQVPLILVGVRWLQAGLAGSSRVTVALAVAAVVALSLPTSAFHLTDAFARLSRRTLPEYLDRERAEAVAWLAASTADSDVVLAAPPIAPFIPVLAHNRMYMGDYEAPTADFARKHAEVTRVLQPGAAPAELTRLLRDEHIRYVFSDDDLRGLGGAGLETRLDAHPDLQIAFRNRAVSIYEFRR